MPAGSEPAPDSVRQNAPAGYVPSASFGRYSALCAADPLAWLAADLVLLVPFFKNMMHRNYQYLYGGVEQHLLGK